MPYAPKQATAIFLDISRRKGMAAAKEFARKHKSDMRGRKYSARKNRSK